MKEPKVNVDIMVVRNGKFLLGMLGDKWTESKPMWALPGREIRFGEKIGDTVERNIREECGAKLKSYKITSVNANYALGNHYIGIGVVAKIEGKPKLLMSEDWKEWRWFSKNEIPETCSRQRKTC